MATSTTKAGRASRLFREGVATVPFFAYLAVFLFLPTAIVVVGAFRTRDGSFTLEAIGRLFTPATAQIFLTTAWLSLASAAIGAVVGGVAAYALSTVPLTSPIRRIFTSVASVLAQFGGVMLAFAFIAVLGKNGNLTRLMADAFNVTIPGDFLTTVPGLIVVYCYF